MALVCKLCGYKQYDIDTVKEARKIFPGVESHDIPYYCGACLENASDEEYAWMKADMTGEKVKKHALTDKKTEKYVLMYCQEREMLIKGIFDTPEAAHDAMKADFRKYLVVDYGIDQKDVEVLDRVLGDKTYENEVFFPEYGFEKTSAWSNIDDDCNIDWKIEKIEI